MLKFTNQQRTAAVFNGTSISLAAPEEWYSIGDGPTREAVLAWLAEGNTAEPADIPDPRIAIQAQIDELERLSLMNRGSREMAMRQIEERAAVDATPERTAQQILDEQPFYVKLKALDDQIAALRAQL